MAESVPRRSVSGGASPVNRPAEDSARREPPPASNPSGAETHELSGLDDDAAIRRVLRGETSAYAAVVARHGERLFRLAYSILRDRGLAEDAVQDAFVKAYTHLSTFRGRARFSTWLHRIAVREALQRRRARARRPETPLGALGTGERLAVENRPHPGAPPERPAEVRDLLARLPEMPRAAVLLRDVEGLTYEEISAVLGASPGTVASWIHRGRERMRKEWRA